MGSYDNIVLSGSINGRNMWNDIEKNEVDHIEWESTDYRQFEKIFQLNYFDKTKVLWKKYFF